MEGLRQKSQGNMSGYHTPVMIAEVIDSLNIEIGKRYVDATVGGGGHTDEITKRGGMVLGIDVDADAIREVGKKNIPNLRLVQGNFWQIETIAKENGFDQVDGILFDLGVSSHQIDTPARGFSYRSEGPLDLRLNQNKGETASQLINRLSENELYEIIATFAEENNARSIARDIVRARSIKKFKTTNELAIIISNKHALARVFQALRITVNDELVSLKKGLLGAQRLLKPGGRLVVISFHSLEDRIVKEFFRNGPWKIVTKKPIRARSEELARNPRSKSAKLRVGVLER